MSDSPFQPPALAARGLSKTYHLYDRPQDRLWQALWPARSRARAFAALTDVSFEVRHGEVLGIVGRNGAGKSTLLQLVCGTLQPSAGELQVDGRVAALLELGAGFNPEFTGRENVFLNAALLGYPEADIRARYDEIVAFADIGEFIDQPVKTYSSGMVVRLAFAVAVHVEPDILVIDEALSVGDGRFARKSFDRIMALKDSGRTIVFCSHSMYQVEVLCDRALWLERGQLRGFGPAREVLPQYQSFLDAVQAPAAAPVAPSPARPAGTARLTNVAVHADGVRSASAAVPLPVRSRISTVSVTVGFTFDPALPLPNVGVALILADGSPIASAITREDGVSPMETAPGEGTATLEFPNVPLLRGRYWVSAYLLCERGVLAYDEALRVAELAVEHEGSEVGIVHLEHRWRDEPARHAA